MRRTSRHRTSSATCCEHATLTRTRRARRTGQWATRHRSKQGNGVALLPHYHRGLAPPTCRCTVAQWTDTAWVRLPCRHNGYFHLLACTHTGTHALSSLMHVRPPPPARPPARLLARSYACTHMPAVTFVRLHRMHAFTQAPRSQPVYDEEITKMLDEWVQARSHASAQGPHARTHARAQAKRGKDFTTSDKLREILRARNVDPDTARPGIGHPGHRG